MRAADDSFTPTHPNRRDTFTNDDEPIIESLDDNDHTPSVTTTTESSPNNHQTSSSNNSEEEKKDNDLFECNICFDPAQEPVITVCGHLFCWPCLFKWINASNNKSLQCPVCKAGIEMDKIIPIYGRGGSSKSANVNAPPSSSNNSEEENIPSRPRGHRPQAQPNPNYSPFGQQQHAHVHGHPLNMRPPYGPNFQFSDGFNFFPLPFFGFGFQTSFNFGGNRATTNIADASGSSINDRDLFDDEALRRHFFSRLLCLMGVLVLLTILFM